MTILYCDTSIVVAYYVPETHSDEAEQSLEAHAQRVVSTLVVTEASSALRRKVHDRALSRAQGQSAFEALREDIANGLFRLVELERRHYDHAAQVLWMTTERLRTLDALHVSIAALDGYHLGTADDLMRKAAKSLGVAVEWGGD